MDEDGTMDGRSLNRGRKIDEGWTKRFMDKLQVMNQISLYERSSREVNPDATVVETDGNPFILSADDFHRCAGNHPALYFGTMVDGNQ